MLDIWKGRLKKLAFRGLRALRLDRAFRRINRGRITVVMYHGVTRHAHSPGIWTQVPVDLFRAQLHFLKRHYRLMHLDEFLRALEDPERVTAPSALVTFDDGLKNNFSVAYPVLSELQVPATLFLTHGLIGSDRMLWVDELYLRMKELWEQGRGAEMGGAIRELGSLSLQPRDLNGSYYLLVEALKRKPSEYRKEVFRRMGPLENRWPWSREDLGFLDWGDVHRMAASGLIDFGLHTATHPILSSLGRHELEAEIRIPKADMEERLEKEVAAFCYPNGVPGIDFGDEHMAFLRECGFRCAFSTRSGLFDPAADDPFSIARIPVGHDLTAERDHFALSTSGAWQAANEMMGRYRRRSGWT